MSKFQPSKPSRAELLAALTTAGRETSTAAVMFHTTLAALQGLSATETKAIDVLDRHGALTAGESAEAAAFEPPVTARKNPKMAAAKQNRQASTAANSGRGVEQICYDYSSSSPSAEDDAAGRSDSTSIIWSSCSSKR